MDLSLSLLTSLVALELVACAMTSIKEMISTKNAPGAIGPYSQAVKVGNTLFLSGQIPIDPKTGQVNAGSIEEQTKLVPENLKGLLASNNMSMNDVVSTTVFLKDLNDFSRMNAVYGSYFDDKPPARATIQVARLPRDVSAEIPAIAMK
jgi:2-iminobutanoate/2-iminopropanoate deaminase